MKLALALLAFAVPANANGIDMLPLYENAPTVTVHHVSHVPQKRKRYKAKPKRKAAASSSPAKVMAYEKRADDDGTRCLSPMRVVGSQDVRPDAAETSAQKAWMEAVRWTHGESYQDFGNASDYQKRCSRSSIGEALGQYFTRCEITAKPCRPGMTEGRNE